MARLPRVTSKLFAENATNNIGQFGSLNAGTKVVTADVATIQALSAWGDGWESAGLGQNCYPTLQERNGLDKVQSYMVNYLYQEGVPEWDANTTYYTGSLVKLINGSDVQLYQSLVDNNTSALSDTNSWLAWDYADRTLSNVTSLSNNIQTLLNAIYQTKLTASAGSSTRPCYMSSGSFYACSGLDSNMRCTSRTTISSTKPDVVIYQYLSSDKASGYRVWASGFKECWGMIPPYSGSAVGNFEVSFLNTSPYAFTDKPTITVSCEKPSAWTHAEGYESLDGAATRSANVNRITTTGFYFSRITNQYYLHYMACGY